MPILTPWISGFIGFVGFVGMVMNLMIELASIGTFVEGAPASLILEFSPLCLGSKPFRTSAPTPTSIGHLVQFREGTFA